METETDSTPEIEKSDIGEEIGGIVSELSDNAPKVSQGVVERAQEKFSELSEMRDESGTPFNPEYHDVNPDGTPKTTKTGKFRKKNKSKLVIPNGAPMSSAPTTAPENVPKNDEKEIKAAAAAMTDTCFSLAYLFSPDFAPIIDAESGLNEPDQLCTAFYLKFKRDGIQEVSPNMMILTVAGMIVARRLRMDDAGGKMRRLGTRFKRLGGVIWAKLRRRHA